MRGLQVKPDLCLAGARAEFGFIGRFRHIEPRQHDAIGGQTEDDEERQKNGATQDGGGLPLQAFFIGHADRQAGRTLMDNLELYRGDGGLTMRPATGVRDIACLASIRPRM